MYATNGRMDGCAKIRPGIYCRGSCAHALAWNVTGKCAIEVNGLPCGLVRVLYNEIHKHVIIFTTESVG